MNPKTMRVAQMLCGLKFGQNPTGMLTVEFAVAIGWSDRSV